MKLDKTANAELLLTLQKQQEIGRTNLAIRNKNENEKIWIARVFRAIALGFLVHGFVTIPVWTLYFERFVEPRITLERIAEVLLENHEGLSMLESAVMAGILAIISFAVWKNRATAIIGLCAFALAVAMIANGIPLYR